MTTTVQPSTGAGVLWTQQGVGTSPGYSAIDLRRADSSGVQEGVMGTGASAQDFMAQQRIAGANLSVDITMPAGGGALVQGDTVSGQGLYYVPVHSTNVNEAIASNSSGNPRVDQVILEVLDNVHDASGNNLSRTRVVQGTATAGATLDNRSGAAALPGSALLLADILVANAASSITNSVIRDRRKWARGAFVTLTRTSGVLQTNSGSYAEMDASGLKSRIECSGVPIQIAISGEGNVNAVPGTGAVCVFVDGTQASGTSRVVVDEATSGKNANLSTAWTLFPAAGSHQFAPAYLTSAGTFSVSASATNRFELVVAERVVQSTGNNSVTTG